MHRARFRFGNHLRVVLSDDPELAKQAILDELRDNHSGDDPEVHWPEHQGDVVELESGTV
ncbi:MAG: hypothetical protein KAJ42_07380 [Gemmatimonadetes bacterium]|nr:hypothetical protein [Gemmatimonadota bacterium]